MERDIALQLKMKENSFKNLRKLKKSDLLKPQQSENVLYRNQLNTLDTTIQILEKDNEFLLA